MSVSFEPSAARNGSSLLAANGVWKRNICIRGLKPSGGVPKLALSMWLPSGMFLNVLAPSSASPLIGSSPSKLPSWLSKPIGAASRWSWKVLMAANSCSPLWFRFFDHEPGRNGSQVQIQTSQPATFGENRCSDQSQSRSLWLAELALISSVWSATLFAFTSA